MPESHTHLRWRLDLPLDLEEAVGAWLEGQGASASYREADPPRAFYAYFVPGARPDPAGLGAFPGARLEAEERFADEDWLAKSREGFGCLEVGRSFFIRPRWDPVQAPPGRTAITVNPGLAFGTGGHETTRLCLELLEDLAARGGLGSGILDVGAGTGILSLAAHLLGGEGILAFDIDPDCGPAMEEFIADNAAVLRHPQPFQPFVGTLDEPRIRAAAPFRLVLANILLETIQELLPAMAGLTAQGGRLVASGILAEREDEALLSLAGAGFMPVKVLREGEWIAILAERRP